MSRGDLGGPGTSEDGAVAAVSGPERPAAADPPVEPVRGALDRAPLWVKGVTPLVLLAILVVVFLRTGPAGLVQQSFPPVEELTIERITLPAPGVMRLQVVNGGPEPVTVSQVTVDDAIWQFSMDGPRRVGRLESRSVTIPFPWVEGEPHTVSIVTSTGLRFTSTIDVAVTTPAPDAGYLWTFALIGIYVGVVPVLIGFLWFPFLRAIDSRWLDFFLSLTIGLLVFLGADALAEALDSAAVVPGAYQGLGLVVIGALGAAFALAAVGSAGGGEAGGRVSPGHVALLIALGIGLHNLGEGLAIGSAYATGEVALGAFLVIGFLIHNTTEGLGIVAPIAGERPRLSRLAVLGLIAGVPTILGAWIGGFTYAPLWVTLFLAIGAGAIAQVVYAVWTLLAQREAGLAAPLNAGGFVLGLLVMYVTGLVVVA